MKLAVLGASGFVGSRVIERFHLDKTFELRAVVRSYGSLARLARFELDWRLADARNELALAEAFSGCDVVLHSVAGNAAFIRESAIPAFRAAVRQNVRRMVFLSSAVVHGQKPVPGTTEDSPLVLREPPYNGGYNRAKVVAEQKLLKERATGATELVILRPGIVFGPRAFWIYKTAQGLLEGSFAWVNHGQGICNSIYVDNLVEAIRLALTMPAMDREAFFVGDRETVTWANLYGPIALSLGYEVEGVPNILPSGSRVSWRKCLEKLHNSTPIQALMPYIPNRFKKAVKAGLKEWFRTPARSPWDVSPSPAPTLSISPEAELLYQCEYRLPHTRAEQRLGYSPPVSFPEGVRRSIEWLASVGYPVRTAISKGDGIRQNWGTGFNQG